MTDEIESEFKHDRSCRSKNNTVISFHEYLLTIELNYSRPLVISDNQLFVKIFISSIDSVIQAASFELGAECWSITNE